MVTKAQIDRIATRIETLVPKSNRLRLAQSRRDGRRDTRTALLLAAADLGGYPAPRRYDLWLTIGMDASPTTPRRSPLWASERRRLRGDGFGVPMIE
jgi:hypothetical protein